MNRAGTFLVLVGLLVAPAAQAQQLELPPSPFAVKRRPVAEQQAVGDSDVAEPGDAAQEGAPQQGPASEAEPSEAEGTAAEAEATADEEAQDDAFAGAEELAPQAQAQAALEEPTGIVEAQDAPASDAHGEETHGEGTDSAHAAAAHGHAEEAHSEAHDPGLLPMVVNFLVLLGIFTLLFRKPLHNFLTNRRARVIEGLEESKRLREAAERKYAEYSERLAHLDEELAKLRKEMIQAGEAERDRIIAEAEARAARMRRDAQFVIDQQMKQLKADLTREAIEAAVKAAEEVLMAQTSAADQERLAQAYLGSIQSTLKKSEVQA